MEKEPTMFPFGNFGNIEKDNSISGVEEDDISEVEKEKKTKLYHCSKRKYDVLEGNQEISSPKESKEEENRTEIYFSKSLPYALFFGAKQNGKNEMSFENGVIYFENYNNYLEAKERGDEVYLYTTDLSQIPKECRKDGENKYEIAVDKEGGVIPEEVKTYPIDEVEKYFEITGDYNEYIKKKEETEKRREMIDRTISNSLIKNYNKGKDNKERIEEIVNGLKALHEVATDVFKKEDLEEIIGGLNEISDKDLDKEEFISNVRNRLEPFIILYSKNFSEVEEGQRKIFNKEKNFIPLNDVISYGISRNKIHLHHPPARSIPKEERMKQYIEAFLSLEKVVEENEDVEEITAISYLLTKSFFSEMLKEYGFNIERPSQDVIERHFKGEEREILYASISREDFLKNISKLKEGFKI
jgi:hypothetical protein